MIFTSYSRGDYYGRLLYFACYPSFRYRCISTQTRTCLELDVLRDLRRLPNRERAQ